MEVKRPQHEDELDARLSELFRSAGPLEPPAGFAERTMQAVRVVPLPAGRRAFRHAWNGPVGWMTLAGGAAAIVCGLALNQALAARTLASVLELTLHAGAQLVRYLVAVFAMTELFATVGNAVSRAAATREGTTTLMLTAVVAGTSLLALQRLLFSKGEESQWQELS